MPAPGAGLPLHQDTRPALQQVRLPLRPPSAPLDIARLQKAALRFPCWIVKKLLLKKYTFEKRNRVKKLNDFLDLVLKNSTVKTSCSYNFNFHNFVYKMFLGYSQFSIITINYFPDLVFSLFSIVILLILLIYIFEQQNKFAAL